MLQNACLHSSKMHKVKLQGKKGWIYNYRWIFQYPFKIFHRTTKNYKDTDDFEWNCQSVLPKWHFRIIHQTVVENMHIFIAHETFTKTDQTLK